MHCEDARDTLLERLDTDPGAELEGDLGRHLEACPQCRGLREDMLALEAQARVWHDLTPPPWNPLPTPGGTAGAAAAGWRVTLLQWFPPLASAATLLLAAGIYFSATGNVAPAPESVTTAPATPLDGWLEVNRQERQQEMEALTTLLKAEMDRRSQETEQSLKYIISHQIQSQRQLETLRGRLQNAGAVPPEQL